MYGIKMYYRVKTIFRLQTTKEFHSDAGTVSNFQQQKIPICFNGLQHVIEHVIDGLIKQFSHFQPPSI